MFKEGQTGINDKYGIDMKNVVDESVFAVMRAIIEISIFSEAKDSVGKSKGYIGILSLSF